MLAVIIIRDSSSVLLSFGAHQRPNNLNAFYCLKCFAVLIAKSCLATQLPVAHPVPLSVGFSRQEYGSGLPFPSPGYLPDAGTEPLSPALTGRFFTTELPGKSKCFGAQLSLPIDIPFTYGTDYFQSDI